MSDTFTVYSLWRSFSGDCKELVRLSMRRDELRQLMVKDSAKWTLPVEYTLDHHLVTGDPAKEGRISAFREAGKLFDKLADDWSVGTGFHSAYRHAACKMFALMEQETSK